MELGTAPKFGRSSENLDEKLDENAGQILTCAGCVTAPAGPKRFDMRSLTVTAVRLFSLSLGFPAQLPASQHDATNDALSDETWFRIP